MEEEVEVTAEEPIAHQISVSLVESAPAKVDAGAGMVLKVTVSCSWNCDLRGQKVQIIAQDDVVEKEIELTKFDGTANETDEFVVRSPIEPGEFSWTAWFPAYEKDGILHGEGSTRHAFVVQSHATSMAVWNVSSPVVVGTSLQLTTGVKCSGDCDLSGQEIEIFDHEGAKIATGILNSAPYSDKVDLYWTEVELEAPDTKGSYRWDIRFPEPKLALPHEATLHPFGFSAVDRPDCTVTVEVVDKEKDRPIKDARILLRPDMHRGSTDERGVAKLQVPKGEYWLLVRAKVKAPLGVKYNLRGAPLETDGREYLVYVPESNRESRKPFQTTIQADGDVAIKVELVGVVEPLEEDTL